MLYYTLNKPQESACRALAYRVADLEHFKERYGTEDPDYKYFQNEVVSLFGHLDQLNVLWSLQNAILYNARNWRRYLQEDIFTTLKSRGYIVTLEK